MKLEVTLTPADFAAFQQRDLTKTVCVVFDVLRATSSMIIAVANGAASIRPVADIPEALAERRRDPEVLLAGERHGLRITSEITGSIDFDLGNSPREFTADKVAGRRIVMTTTNGTRGLQACAGARAVFATAFLNLGATARVVSSLQPEELIVVCSGTFEESAYEDTLAAGALCDLMWSRTDANVSDSALISRKLWLEAKGNLLEALGQAKNGRRLLERPALRDDVAFCARIDAYAHVLRMSGALVAGIQ